ncbi:MAG: hypothetical protein L0Y44_11225 [Phycisphaerales bacterium]|nr:hypothetical protein [Phycisphaerales bacterium]MCI0631210.1 hypothetical protein [Phycisphaerales bacterium]MCI0677248.1 hypothetical protein [Phycisphaerales bacterium]
MDRIVSTVFFRHRPVRYRFGMAGAVMLAVIVGLWLGHHMPDQKAQAFPFIGGAAIPTWGTMASAGTVDEASSDAIALSGTQASIAGATGSGTLRYNFVVVNGFDSQSDGFSLWTRFRDNGPASRVRVWFKSTDIVSGETSTLATFDSNDYPTSVNYQLAGIDNCNVIWDFYNKVYFVEARLDKTNSTGNPGLAAIQVSELTCTQ